MQNQQKRFEGFILQATSKKQIVSGLLYFVFFSPGILNGVFGAINNQAATPTYLSTVLQEGILQLFLNIDLSLTNACRLPP